MTNKAPEPGYGYLVARHGLPESVAWQAGQSVESYRLLSPLPTVSPRQRPREKRIDAHQIARALAPEAAGHVRSGAWKPVVEHRCNCQRRERLATEYAGPHGRWVVIHRGEQIPPAFRRDDHDPAPTAWTLHAEPEAPHVEMTTCRRCRQVWCIALTWQASHLIGLAPTYGATVTP